MGLVASAGLHGPPGLKAGDAVRGDTIIIQLGVEHLPSVWVMSGEIQQVNTREDDQEAAEQRNGVDRIGGVEPLEENE